MALEIFKLVGSVMVDTSKANDSLSQTDNKALNVASTLGKGIKTAAKWGAAVVSAAAGAAGAFIKTAQSAAANLDEIDKGSQRMGVTAEQYQEMAYAAGLCGIEMSTMEKAAKNLQKNTDYNFDQAIDEIMSFSTAEERAARASELFGDSVAYQLAPMLNGTADDLEAMKGEAHALGLVMSDDTVAAGASMSDAFSKISQTIDVLKNTVMIELMPVINQVLDWVTSNLPLIQDFVGQAVEAIKPVIEGLMTFLEGVFTGDWSKMWEGMKDIFKGAFDALKTIFKDPINWIVGKLNSFIDSVNSIQIPDWVPGVGGKGLNLAHIPLLAKGGVLEKGQTGFLEGNGAEAVVPLSQNRAWTQAVAEDMNSAIGGAEVVALLEDILTAIENISGDLYLDGTKLVGGIASRMDQKLGGIAINRKKGIA